MAIIKQRGLSSTLIRRFRKGQRVAAIVENTVIRPKVDRNGQYVRETPTGPIVRDGRMAVTLIDTSRPGTTIQDVDRWIDASHERDLTASDLTIEDFYQKSLYTAHCRNPGSPMKHQKSAADLAAEAALDKAFKLA